MIRTPTRIHLWFTDPACPPGWLGFRHSCYFFYVEALGFDGARKLCGNVSSSLVIIGDVEEQVSRCEHTFCSVPMKMCLIWIYCENADVFSAGCTCTLWVEDIFGWDSRTVRRRTFGDGWMDQNLSSRMCCAVFE